MELKEKLKEAIAKQQNLGNQLRVNKEQEQSLLKEILRGEGEVLTLKALIKEEEQK